MTDIVPIKKPRIIADIGGPVDETRLTLGVYGADLEPAEVSNLLRCVPTSAHRRGDSRRGELPPWPQGAWLFSVEGSPPTGPEELVGLMFDQLPQEPTIWERLRARYAVKMSFGIFVSQWNRGFELSPISVGRLAAIGADVGFNIYSEIGQDGE